MASRIRTARKQAGYTSQMSFAAALGVGKRSVERWEAGESPSVENILLIASKTGKTAGYLLGDEEEASSLDRLIAELAMYRDWAKSRERVA